MAAGESVLSRNDIRGVIFEMEARDESSLEIVEAVISGINAGDLECMDPGLAIATLANLAVIADHNPTTKAARALFHEYVGGELPSEALRYGDYLADFSKAVAANIIGQDRYADEERVEWVECVANALYEGRYIQEGMALSLSMQLRFRPLRKTI
ncbi:hypothetical protein JW710_01745 [Candidatus Dojkabacteria bacterium]|nr:hypothetical protein [Candidatus Dojkabacteria bacterium]